MLNKLFAGTQDFADALKAHGVSFVEIEPHDADARPLQLQPSSVARCETLRLLPRQRRRIGKETMNISALQKWLEVQKSLHGDVEVVCMTAPCHDPMGQILSTEELRVSTPSMLGMDAGGLDDDATVLAIGYGNGF